MISRKTFVISIIVIILAVMVIAAGILSSQQPAPQIEEQNTAIFDFDHGKPQLAETTNTPFNQTTNGITATFSSPADKSNPAFSIQSHDTTFVQLSTFSSQWLYDNAPSKETLQISFNQNLRNIEIAFATVEYSGGPGTQPTEIRLMAYKDSANTTPLIQTTARGTFVKDPYPQGILSLESTEPFNIVTIDLPISGPNLAKDFYIDNISVKLASGP